MSSGTNQFRFNWTWSNWIPNRVCCHNSGLRRLRNDDLKDVQWHIHYWTEANASIIPSWMISNKSEFETFVFVCDFFYYADFYGNFKFDTVVKVRLWCVDTMWCFFFHYRSQPWEQDAIKRFLWDFRFESGSCNKSMCRMSADQCIGGGSKFEYLQYGGFCSNSVQWTMGRYR